MKSLLKVNINLNLLYMLFIREAGRKQRDEERKEREKQNERGRSWSASKACKILRNS